MAELTVGHVNLARGFRGGERQTELLIACLSRLGVKQYLVCRAGSPLAEHLDGTPDLEIIELRKRIDLRFNGHKYLADKCDVIQAHEARATQWAFVHYLLYKTPYATTRRVPESVRDNVLNRAIYAKAAAVVAISSAIGEGLKAQFKREIELIPSSCAHFAVNKVKANEINNRFAHCFVIGHIGALVDRHKGQSVLIKATEILKREIPNLKVVFLGSGIDLEKFKEQGKNLGDALVFEGFVSNVADYIKSFDVFAYPSNYEGLGSVLLDVMEQGIPVVATAVDGIPDIVKDHDSGLLIEKGDAKALADAVLKIKNNASLKEKLIQGALDMAKAHSPELMAASYLALYKKLLKH